MHVTLQENEKYRQFVSDIATEMGVFDFKGDDIVWHYTNGDGFLGMLQTSTIYATQVSCLNDTTETKYASDIYKTAVAELIKEREDDTEGSCISEPGFGIREGRARFADAWHKQILCNLL